MQNRKDCIENELFDIYPPQYSLDEENTTWMQLKNLIKHPFDKDYRNHNSKAKHFYENYDFNDRIENQIVQKVKKFIHDNNFEVLMSPIPDWTKDDVTKFHYHISQNKLLSDIRNQAAQKNNEGIGFGLSTAGNLCMTLPQNNNISTATAAIPIRYKPNTVVFIYVTFNDKQVYNCRIYVRSKNATKPFLVDLPQCVTILNSCKK